MNEPDKILLRRKDVLLWTGIDGKAFDHLVSAKVVKGVIFPGAEKRYFHKEHIRTVLIDAARAAGSEDHAKDSR